MAVTEWAFNYLAQKPIFDINCFAAMRAGKCLRHGLAIAIEQGGFKVRKGGAMTLMLNNLQMLGESRKKTCDCMSLVSETSALDRGICAAVFRRDYRK